MCNFEDRLKKELEKLVKTNNRQVPQQYLQGVYDGRVETADFLLELLENGEL